MATSHDNTKRAAVLASLLTGESVSAVARAHGVGKATVSRWRDEAGFVPDAERSGTEKKGLLLAPSERRDLGERVGDYLDDILVTLRAQAIHGRDPVWLQAQGADALAIFHGVLADKAIRLLGALQSDEPLPLEPPA